MSENDDITLKYEDVANLEEGKIYPFYGVITKILEEEDEIITKFQLNFESIVSVDLRGQKDYSDTIKQRIFEPGIFMSTFHGVEGGVPNLSCSTIIFGKRQETLEQ
jgi:hypothetical protein